MSVRPILLWPDPRLSQRCEPVGADEDVSALIGDMLETMYDAPGRGLAAPQVGVMKRVFVMDCGWKDGDMTPIICINPEIVAASEDVIAGEEGCLSIPNAPADVTRPARITLRWRGLDGAIVDRKLDGFEAKCAQHEYDHLEGRVIFDHLSAEDRDRIEGAYLGRTT
ncbi:Peptide deformylase [Thalassovita gelatinovora]|uniref:Peptide deformylase n=1 Tax=Thalassovita gelatinovora TaxID=53501 RepID=A0A0P1FE04_THAGE|nr:peptide deformylase [Thalassovita gelatinovora]QIZ81450.1 peptide deformylase [Thalassovita gelatinovora]CUH66271.1 Peptide deformylase [Thalassovita gelatinovora]SEQ22706.1 peptide deformylase [Thalassovita gelatinovora]